MGLSCPHPVPEYIRLIGQGRYTDACMVNWVSNVFPGILGRTCDRPCEPACRRSRVEENNGPDAGPPQGGSAPSGAGAKPPGGSALPEPVAICRLKRVAADMKNDVRQRMPKLSPKNVKRIACIGAGPASLTVARDLAPLGYEVTVFDGEARAGGFIRTQIPRFRLPDPMTNLMPTKMGIHEWSCDNDTSNDARVKVPWVKAEIALGAYASRWRSASTPQRPSRRPGAA